MKTGSYTGAFSVYAARGGAKRVVSVDASEPANVAARGHLEKNGFSPEAHPVLRDDVFQYLRKTEASYDLIILDPPRLCEKPPGGSARRPGIQGHQPSGLSSPVARRFAGDLLLFQCH
jgi:23S rRNA G2069 N7-methylase RlmK/C1962 C5-methylase RlmI